MRYFRITVLQRMLFKNISKRLEKSINPDVAVAFEEGRTTLLLSNFNCKKIAWIHCNYKYYISVNHPKLRYERHCYQKYDKIVCVSQYTAESFKDIFENLSYKVHFIYNPINTKRILLLSKAVINDNMFKNDMFTIISVGRYTETKQFHLIPDIVKSILEISADLKFRWFIIGAGNNKLMNETREKIKMYGIEDKLVLLGSRDNPYPYMKAADLYVCTSYSEAYPCVINEAKVLGLPVISNAFPSSKEVLTDKDGIIVGFESIYQAIYEMIIDNNHCHSSIKGRLWTVDNDNILKQINNLFLT